MSDKHYVARKHTPGPWDWEWSPRHERYFVFPVANPKDLVLEGHLAPADVRLIVAAPDMEAALEGVISRYGQSEGVVEWPEIRAAREALAKACGAA